MKIALTVEALSPNLTGIGRYTWELAQRLDQIDVIDEVSFYRNGVWIQDIDALIGQNSPIKKSSYLWRKIKRSLARFKARGKIFHGPNYFLPPMADRGVITIHDLSVLHYPEMHPEDRVKYFADNLQDSIARAEYVITDSAFIRNEVIRTFSLADSKVTSIPLGVSSLYRPRSADELFSTLQRYHLEVDGYTLCVSTIEPRKKVLALLKAWELLPPSTREHWPLVVVGAGGWLNGDIEEALDRGSRAGWVRYLGFVAQEDLPSLYAGARLFVYPSVYEGFGLPPVEAMASGVPTIVSNKSCLPEVTQGAALQIDPDDLSSFKAALEKGLIDTQWRAGAIAAGRAVAAAYSWDNCAEKTAKVYGRVAEAGL